VGLAAFHEHFSSDNLLLRSAIWELWSSCLFSRAISNVYTTRMQLVLLRRCQQPENLKAHTRDTFLTNISLSSLEVTGWGKWQPLASSWLFPPSIEIRKTQISTRRHSFPPQTNAPSDYESLGGFMLFESCVRPGPSTLNVWYFQPVQS